MLHFALRSRLAFLAMISVALIFFSLPPSSGLKVDVSKVNKTKFIGAELVNIASVEAKIFPGR